MPEITSVDTLAPFLGQRVIVTVPNIRANGERTDGHITVLGTLAAARDDVDRDGMLTKTEMWFEGPANQFAIPYLSVSWERRPATSFPTITAV